MKQITKADLNSLIERIIKMINLNILPTTITSSILKFYDKGLERAELELNLNFVRDNEVIKTLNDYVVGNVKGLNEEMREKLRKEITQGVMNLESISKVQKRIQKVIGVSQERAKLIARTELHRAEVTGSMTSARQSGLKLLKQWDAHLDKRTCKFCAALDGQTIPLDKKFNHNGIMLDSPADNHPNCRCTIKTIQK